MRHDESCVSTVVVVRKLVYLIVRQVFRQIPPDHFPQHFDANPTPALSLGLAGQLYEQLIDARILLVELSEPPFDRFVARTYRYVVVRVVEQLVAIIVHTVGLQATV